MFEVLFAVRKDKFKTNPAIQLSLDLIDENEQYTHMITLDDPCERATMLDVFQYDEQCEENEAKYKEIRKTSLHENSNNEDESSSASSNNDEEGDVAENSIYSKLFNHKFLKNNSLTIYVKF
ncbi:unnamed protein product [Rotaria sp. Silwood1]|nr:unnamed protein product [Rotaria sp. Silwood1]